ncbi:MAG TPA: hypothetical protein VLM38_17915 [Blastocatellia bacterium]|nr:hypothetical protein [Blastocatellia bacterium]
MAERDKIIKSGQITLPRILFLAVVGGLIVFTVYAGGVYLSIGYWLITLAICALLVLIAMDYGVTMDKVSLSGQAVQPPATAEAATSPTPGIKTTMGEAAGVAASPRPKRRTSRPAKRRR